MGRGWKELDDLPPKSLDCSKRSARVMLAGAWESRESLRQLRDGLSGCVRMLVEM